MQHDSKKLEKLVHIDESRIQEHLGELVRWSMEETLNTMLDADALCVALLSQRVQPCVEY